MSNGFWTPNHDDYHENMRPGCVDMSLDSLHETALDKQEGGTHYKNLQIQPVEYIKKNSIPYLEGNVIKYVTRHREKNGVEDIKKAIHYLEMILEFDYK